MAEHFSDTPIVPPVGASHREDDRSFREPELGGSLRDGEARSGAEPELGGPLRQKAVYVDEVTCIGCKHCAHVAGNTFYIEPDYGRSRVVRQGGDAEALIQEAIDMCPVDCIHWVDYTALKHLEAQRKNQVIPRAGFPINRATLGGSGTFQSLNPQPKPGVVDSCPSRTECHASLPYGFRRCGFLAFAYS